MTGSRLVLAGLVGVFCVAISIGSEPMPSDAQESRTNRVWPSEEYIDKLRNERLAGGGSFSRVGVRDFACVWIDDFPHEHSILLVAGNRRLRYCLSELENAGEAISSKKVLELERQAWSEYIAATERSPSPPVRSQELRSQEPWVDVRHAHHCSLFLVAKFAPDKLAEIEQRVLTYRESSMGIPEGDDEVTRYSWDCMHPAVFWINLYRVAFPEIAATLKVPGDAVYVERLLPICKWDSPVNVSRRLIGSKPNEDSRVMFWIPAVLRVEVGEKKSARTYLSSIRAACQ